MLVSELYRQLIGNVLFHYTPCTNSEEIKKHMFLYSNNQLVNKGINPQYMSNKLSREVDRRLGLHNYVFLVFRSDHPLIYKICQSGISLTQIPIDVSILDIPGVLISDRVANDSMASFYTPYDALVLKIKDCHKGFISDRSIWEEIKKYEILIPNSIDINKYYAGVRS